MTRSTTLDNSGTLGTQDLHSHTTMSDGDLELWRVVELAIERGVAIGISDHVSSRNPGRFIGTERDLRNYLDALEEVPVFRAGEFCWCDRFGENLPAELLDRLDYRIGSNHGFALPDGVFASPWWTTLPRPWDSEPHRLMDVMVDNLCDMVRAMPVQIAAHPTLMPPALRALEDDVHAWWTDEREDRFVEAAAESGVALEISNRYRLPHDRFLKKAKQAGARFSLGSDGHGEDQVARLEWSIETARRVGIADDDLFIAEFRQLSRYRSQAFPIKGAPGMETDSPGNVRSSGEDEVEVVRVDEDEMTDDERARRNPGAVRAEDTEPYIALQYVARLFKIAALVVMVALIAEIVAGLALEGAGAMLPLIMELIRGVVLAAILWGAGDLTMLLIDVGHDVRAARVLLGRLSARGSDEKDDSPTNL